MISNLDRYHYDASTVRLPRVVEEGITPTQWASFCSNDRALEKNRVDLRLFRHNPATLQVVQVEMQGEQHAYMLEAVMKKIVEAANATPNLPAAARLDWHLGVNYNNRIPDASIVPTDRPRTLAALNAALGNTAAAGNMITQSSRNGKPYPNVIIEVGWNESLPDIRADVAHWSANPVATGVQEVFGVKVFRTLTRPGLVPPRVRRVKVVHQSLGAVAAAEFDIGSCSHNKNTLIPAANVINIQIPKAHLWHGSAAYLADQALPAPLWSAGNVTLDLRSIYHQFAIEAENLP